MMLNKTHRAVLSGLIVLLMFCLPVNAVPEIDTWNNSITGDVSLYPVADDSQSITFTANATETITTWTWYIDSVLQSNNYDNITTSFNEPFNHNVSVIAKNAGGSTGMLTWYPVVHRAVSVTHVETLNESGYDRILGAFEGDTDWEEFISATTVPYTIPFGRLFFLFVFGIYFVMLWMRQEDSIVPIVLAFSIGGILLGMISEDFAGTAVLFIIIGGMGVMYSLYRER